jgi:hypothetical protein
MDILIKLKNHLNSGIDTEADAVYLLSQIRKTLEQQKLKEQYEYLTFHCDWVLHFALAGRTTQKILRVFDEANIYLKKGVELYELPAPLDRELAQIFKLEHFKDELEGFLKAQNLPHLTVKRPDAWPHFFHLYAKVVEHCPLTMNTKDSNSTIRLVTVHFELANAPLGEHMLYKITWTVLDKNGLTGDLFVMNSFSLKES